MRIATPLGDYQSASLSTPIGALREFREAFEAQDVERLASVWLMNPEERSAVESLFLREGNTSFRLELRGDLEGDDRATIDFDQSFAAAPAPPQRGLDRLRAQVSSTEDGRWIIVQITSRH